MKYKKILLKGLIIFGVLLVCMSIYIFYVRTSGMKSLNKTLAEIKTKGYLQDLETLLPSKIPDNDNFYLDVVKAHDKLLALDSDPEWNKLFQKITLEHQVDFNEPIPSIIQKHKKEVTDIIDELTKNLWKSGFQTIRIDRISDKQPSEALYSLDLQNAMLEKISILTTIMTRLNFLNRICFIENDRETSRQILKIMQKICSSYNEIAYIMMNRFVHLHMQDKYHLSLKETIEKFPNIDFNKIFAFDEKTDKELWLKSLIFELNINFHTTKDIADYQAQNQWKEKNIPFFTSFAMSYNSIIKWIDLGHHLTDALKAGLNNIENIKQDNWFPNDLYRKSDIINIYEILSVQLWLTNISFKRTVSTQRLIKIATAVLNYRNKYKAYPETLDKLVPEFLNELLKCALTKKDFIYENDGTSKTLRGFEEDYGNRSDDGGIHFIPAKRFIIKFPD